MSRGPLIAPAIADRQPKQRSAVSTARWVETAPFGWPVVPEVYRISASSSGATSTAGMLLALQDTGLTATGSDGAQHKVWEVTVSMLWYGRQFDRDGRRFKAEGFVDDFVVEEGLRFAVREGGRTVGSGVIDTIIE